MHEKFTIDNIKNFLDNNIEIIKNMKTKTHTLFSQYESEEAIFESFKEENYPKEFIEAIEMMWNENY